MAENGNGNGERIKQAAENALLTLASRWIVVFGVPLILGLVAFIGKAVWDDVRELKTTLAAQYIETTKALGSLDVRLSVTETRVEQLERARP